MRKLETIKGDGGKMDTQIAAGMCAAALLSDQGLQALKQVVEGANDPAQAIAHVIFMALDKVRQKLAEKGIKIDDRIWIAGGGVLDRVLFEVAGALYGILGYQQIANSQFVHSIKEGVLDLMQDHEDGVQEQGPEEAPQQESQESPNGLMAPISGGMQ